MFFVSATTLEPGHHSGTLCEVSSLSSNASFFTVKETLRVKVISSSGASRARKERSRNCMAESLQMAQKSFFHLLDRGNLTSNTRCLQRMNMNMIEKSSRSGSRAHLLCHCEGGPPHINPPICKDNDFALRRIICILWACPVCTSVVQILRLCN